MGMPALMKAKWALAPAVTTLLLISGCSSRSMPQATPSPTPTITPTASIDRSVVYSQATAYLQSFLDSWQKNGLYLAGQKYLDPSMRPNPTQKTPILIAGTVTRTQPGVWVSANNFTVLADLKLQFSGSAGAWGNGTRARYVTFVRSSASAPYQIMFATNDP